MAGSSILVINAAGAETRVALVESGSIHEFYLERKREKGIVGNIYKGRVVRVLPGMQAAFVDIGLEKAAFLYVGDVTGDPDFSEEFELTEGEHAGSLHEVPTEQEAEDLEIKARAAAENPPEPHPDSEAEPTVDVTASQEGPSPVADEFAAASEGPSLTPAPFGVTEGIEEPAAPDLTSPEEQSPVEGQSPAEPSIDAAAPLTPIPLTQAVGFDPVPAPPPLLVPELPPAGATDPAEADQVSAAEPSSGQLSARPAEAAREARGDRESREGRGRRDDRRHGRDRNGRNGHNGHGHGRGRDDDRRPREAKNIQDLLKEGQEVIVQVAKDPIGTKGARITSHISLPGRHLVFMPTVDHIGISRRIEKDAERRRLREIVDRLRPEGTGFIVRTVAENVEAQKLEADIRFLIQVWNEIIRTKDKVGAPALLHPDLDLILRATRDLFTADVQKLVIDDRGEYERILRFVEEQAPHLKSQIELYESDEPIFDAYGIEQEIKRASQRKVWLRSGGYLIMDQAEALTAVDVNSGRYVGKKNLEETITKINVEAAKEIVYQLRLRNIGGIIIIDFIDMDKPQNRDKVFKALQEALGRDKAKTNVLKISELGLVEMTRKRVRESVTRMMAEPCSYCDGKGHIKSKVTVAYEIFREIRRDSSSFQEPVMVINCHPEVARILQGAERDELRYLMDRFNKTIQVKTQQGYHQEQFDIYGRQDRDKEASGGREGGGREGGGRESGGREGGGREGREGGGRESGGREGGGREGGGRRGGRGQRQQQPREQPSREQPSAEEPARPASDAEPLASAPRKES